MRRSTPAAWAGYLLKDSAMDEVRTAIHAVQAGRRFIGSAMAERLVRKSASAGAGGGAASVLATLTPTERKVLRLISEGQSSKEIGEVLSIHYRTVENHRTNMCRKLDLEGANALVRYALQHRAALAGAPAVVKETAPPDHTEPVLSRLNLDIRHHAAVLVLEDVAVIHEASGNPVPAGNGMITLTSPGLTVAHVRHVDGIHHPADIVLLAVARRHQEVRSGGCRTHLHIAGDVANRPLFDVAPPAPHRVVAVTRPTALSSR